MDKIQRLDLMDKILRELHDLQNSQTSVLKKVSQIEAHNINLGVSLLDERLPDLHDEINSAVDIVTDLEEQFEEMRNKFYTENNIAAMQDPTA